MTTTSRTAGALKVLVVDDDFRVADLHRGIVEERPGLAAIGAARSLAEARGLLRDGRPDLLLVDAYLPDGDGIDLVRTAGVDAFVLSAASDAATVRRALAAGALGYLIKPFDRRTLGDRLDRWVRYRNIMGADRALEQDDVDRALAILHGSAEPASVSRSATEQLILERLGTDEASAAEIADRAGISRATAQRHLAALATRGIVDVRLRYGSTGRPEHRYVVLRG